MSRTRGRDGSVIRHNNARRGVHTSMHGRLAIELGSIPYSGPSNQSRFPQSFAPSSSTPSSSLTPSSSSTPSSSTPSSSFRSAVRQDNVPPSTSRIIPVLSPVAPTVQYLSTPTLFPTWGPPLQSTPTPSSVHFSSAPSVPVTPQILVQPTYTSVQPTHTSVQPTQASVQPSSDTPVQPTPTTHHDIPDEEHDGSGRVIIRPVGKGWAPNHCATKAIGHAIRSQFRGPYYHYDETPEEVQLKWWTEFKTRVTWAPHDEWQIRKVYESKVRKRLSDMLAKARMKATRPNWISEQAWIGLLDYWDSKKFKEQSIQNKLNRSSTRGGALHSTGRKSHLDIALSLERKFGRPVEPDELFMATHTKKDGLWVDSRAKQTYEAYHERLKALQSDNFEGSSSNCQPINPTTKLQCWKDVAGGKSRGRCYGIAETWLPTFAMECLP